MIHNAKVHKCSGRTPNQAKQLQNVMLFLFSVLFTNSHCYKCIEKAASYIICYITYELTDVIWLSIYDNICEIFRPEPFELKL